MEIDLFFPFHLFYLRKKEPKIFLKIFQCKKLFIFPDIMDGK